MVNRPAFAAAALALTTELALAQTTSREPRRPNLSTSSREAGEARPKYRAVRAVRPSLSQAIDVVEAQLGRGGRLVDAEFEQPR